MSELFLLIADYRYPRFRIGNLGKITKSWPLRLDRIIRERKA
jgi:hypothetical protein